MTEVLFGLSAAFVGYVIYVLVDEQMAGHSPQPIYLAPDEEPEAVKRKINKPSSRKTTRTEKTKAKISKTNNAPEQVGMAAGNVYRYLEKSGAISVAKMARELKEDSKTIQRGIGWLAQEGKITLKMVKRVEMISLSEIQSV